MSTCDSDEALTCSREGSRPSHLVLIYVQTLTAVALILSAVFLGAPAAHIDDVWYLDPGVNVARFGELKAPTLTRLMSPFRTDAFFMNPPFHGWLLGGWLKLNGVSSLTVRLFQGVCTVVIALSLMNLFRYFGIRSHACWAVLPVLLAFLNSFGLRPEPCGFALCFLGLALITVPAWPRLFLGCALMGSAVLVSVSSLPVASVFWVAITWQQWRAPASRQAIARSLFTAMASAVLTVTALLWWAIRGDFGGLIEQLAAMAKARGGTFFGTSPIFLSFFSSPQGWKTFTPVYVLFGIASLCYLYRRRAQLTSPETCFLLANVGTLLVAIVYRASEAFQKYWMFPLLGLIAIICSQTLSRNVRLMLSGMTIVTFGWSQILPVVAALCAIPPNEDSLRSLRAELTNVEKGKLVIDEYAARYVFDYRWPDGTLSFYHAEPLPDYYPKPRSRAPGEVLVASPAVLKTYATWLPVRAPRIKVGPVTFNTLAKNPYEIVVIKDQQ